MVTGNNVTTVDIVDKVESDYVSNVKTAAKDDYDGISGDVSSKIALRKSCLLGVRNSSQSHLWSLLNILREPSSAIKHSIEIINAESNRLYQSRIDNCN